LGGLEGLKQKLEPPISATRSTPGSVGENQPSADEVERALPDQVLCLSSELGRSPDEVAGPALELLPEVVSEVTPDGTIPDSDSLMDKQAVCRRYSAEAQRAAQRGGAAGRTCGRPQPRPQRSQPLPALQSDDEGRSG
jgi:YidB-like protein